jgi:pilus assembly protein CpaF
VNGELLDAVRRRLLDLPPDSLEVIRALKAEAPWLAPPTVLDQSERLFDDLYNFGPITTLLYDPDVTDVVANGHDRIWVDRGSGLHASHITFDSDETLRGLVVRLAAISGRPLDEAHPWLDAQVQGFRIHALLPSLASGRTQLSIRRMTRQLVSLTELIGQNAAAENLLALMRSRSSFIITGGTSAGKTTLLSALLGQADSSERIVLVEDTPEIATDHPHVVALQARPANIEGRGAVSIRELIRQSLRMRPDRIVVGEVRGAEVVDLLAALNTGHDGSAGTVHANSAGDLPARLEAMGAAGGMERDFLHSQMASALKWVIHLRPARQGRGIDHLGLLRRNQRGICEVEPVICYNEAGEVISQSADLL